MTSGVENIESKSIIAMNPSYPWTITILAERLCCSYNAVSLAFNRMKTKGLIEKYYPEDEMTYRTGHKWRLTKNGIEQRNKLLGTK